MGMEEDVDVLLDISYRVHCEDWDHLDFIDDIAVDILAIDDECTEPVVVGHILAQYVDLGRWLNAGTPVRAFDIFDAHSQELADLAPHVIDEDGELIPDVVGGFQDILYMSQLDVDEPWPVELKRDSSGDILPGERSRLKNGIARLTDYYGRMGFETLGMRFSMLSTARRQSFPCGG